MHYGTGRGYTDALDLWDYGYTAMAVQGNPSKLLRRSYGRTRGFPYAVLRYWASTVLCLGWGS